MLLVFLSSLLVSSAFGVAVREQTVQERSSLLTDTWGGILDGTGNTIAPKKAEEEHAQATPVGRAVDLLKEMSVTLEKDMDEDSNLHAQLSCWCNTNSDEKKKAIKSNTEKIAELEATIEEGTASSAGLKEKIKELEGEVAENKDTLATATALRKKEQKEFATDEADGVANIANLKAAIVVLSKHHDSAALPQLGTSSLSFLQSQSRKDDPWGLESKEQRDLDMFMSSNSFGSSSGDEKIENRFLQQATPVHPAARKAALEDSWTFGDVTTVQSALKAASSFVQKRGKDASIVPAYSAQSGEIFGVLKQMKEDMEKDLSDAQELEKKRATDFNDLRTAKSAEIEGGEKSSEDKEAELAKTDNDLADAKEDIVETKKTLEADTKFEENLKTTCDEADVNFDLRKKSRLAEMEAVAQTIEILTEDEAKDAMSKTFEDKKPDAKSFLQVSTERLSERRSQAAKFLRRQAAQSSNPELALLANSVESDAFVKVKLAIDKMIETLNTQQSDEVKKHDFCKTEIQENDMATMKGKDTKGDLEASAEERKVAIKTLEEEISAAKLAISKEQVSLQQATENRKKENLDFQKTIADQTITIEVLKKAMNRLAEFYDEALVQTRVTHTKGVQTPPVRQVKYEKSQGGGGVVSLIEKLIYDAKEIMAESKKNEMDSQAAYEEMIEDSNGTVKALSKSVLSKTNSKVEAQKDLSQKEMDLTATTKELDRLAKTDTDLHNECDYILKNFMLRQGARGDEVESLKQAKMILSGAAASA